MVDLLRTLGDLGDRITAAAKAGITFSGARDLYTALGYKKKLGPEDYIARWKRGGLATRIVEALPKATWRGDWELIDDENPEAFTPFEKTWAELDVRLKLKSKIMRGDVLAGFGEFSIILLGAPGKLDTEMPKNMKPELLAYVNVYGQDKVTVDRMDYERNPENPRFGQPNWFTISKMNPGESLGRRVHWSRVVMMADDQTDSDLFGRSRLESPWNLLDDLDKTVGGGAEAFWKRADQGMQFDIDPEVQVTPENKVEMENQIEEFRHGLKRYLRTRGMSINSLGSDVANFSPQVDAIVTLIAGTTGIPKRILVGSEMGELASTQDRSNWAERVGDRRTQWAEPMVLRPLADRFITYGILPAPKNDEYKVRWAAMQSLDRIETAAVAVDWAEVNQKTGKTVVTEDEIRTLVFGLPPLKVVDPKAEKANKQPPAPPAVPGADPDDDDEGTPKVAPLPGEQPDSPLSGSEDED